MYKTFIFTQYKKTYITKINYIQERENDVDKSQFAISVYCPKVLKERSSVVTISMETSENHSVAQRDFEKIDHIKRSTFRGNIDKLVCRKLLYEPILQENVPQAI